jgi:hypothetical protein
MIVRIETPRAASGKTAASGHGTKVTTPEGHEIKGVAAIDVRIRPNEPIQATLGIWSSFLGEGQAIFKILDPNTGELNAVRRIEFVDGTTWENE